MFTLHPRLLLYGLGIWVLGTVALRVFGQRMLHPDRPISIVVLFAISFLLMAWLVRRICSRFRIPREQWPAGAISLALPSLLLDPFSSAFFPAVFPNMSPAAAGLFGGWIICSLAGALSVTLWRR